MITTILVTILTITFAYFLGSISSAILICKILNLSDPRNYGSKNPGATNVFRIAGYKLACSVALFDFLKGITPTYIGLYLELTTFYLQIIIISVCIGHMYPIFFNFYGGKGVATAFGALSALSLDFSIIMLTIWILTILLFRYISLGSIVTALTMPLYVWFVQPQYLIGMILLSFLILIRHKSNIKRLYYHQEHKI